MEELVWKTWKSLDMAAKQHLETWRNTKNELSEKSIHDGSYGCL